MAAKKKTAERIEETGHRNADEFESDLRARHQTKHLFTEGRFTREFRINEAGVPMSEEGHDANKARLVEDARNNGVRVTGIDDVTVDEDEYLEDGRRRIVYSAPVVEALPTEVRKADEDAEAGELDPLTLNGASVATYDANPKPGQGTKGEDKPADAANRQNDKQSDTKKKG
jgi:hypothetical protein